MRALRCWVLVAAAAACAAAVAVPLVPAADGEVVETLPSPSAERSEDRRLQRELAARPRDAELALRAARRFLERARADGDPRLAGRALGALAPWRDDAQAPADVQLMQATLQQHLHDFDGAAERLESLLQRDAQRPQAWLTLATVRRVQGRYADADAACARLLALGGASPYAGACAAENDALRGRHDAARAALQQLIARAGNDAGLRAWLLTTLGEVEQRAGAPQAAERAYRAAQQAAPDAYTALALADLLIEQQRGAEVPAVLAASPRGDAVLLRLALADPGGAAAMEMRARIEQANLRAGTAMLHGREQAMFALGVEGRPQRALQLARDNVRSQREPVDLLVLVRAARASDDAAALDEARTLVRQIGLRDRRIDALL